MSNKVVGATCYCQNIQKSEIRENHIVFVWQLFMKYGMILVSIIGISAPICRLPNFIKEDQI